ncbi:MAG: hypothetical protein WD336_07685 [Trueperaceae bacterium]
MRIPRSAAPRHHHARRLAATFASAVLLVWPLVAAVVPMGAADATTPLFGPGLSADAARATVPAPTDDAGMTAPPLALFWTSKATVQANPAGQGSTGAVARSLRARRPSHKRPRRERSPRDRRDRVQRWYARRNLDGG